MESNDSPEIPDRGETSDIPGLPSGAEAETTRMGNIETTKARVFLPAVAVAAMNCGRTEFCYAPRSNKNILCHGHLILAVNHHHHHPFTARVVGAPQIILQPVFSIFPCSPLLFGTCRTPGLSIPWCCLPNSSSVCLVIFPLSHLQPTLASMGQGYMRV